MRNKILFFSIALLILGGVFSLTKNTHLVSFLSSSVLSDTCSPDMLREERLSYQKTLTEIQAIDTFFVVQKCSSVVAETPQWNLCQYTASEKAKKQLIIEAYDSCRQQLFQSGKLDETIAESVLSTAGIVPGTPQFADPSYTCQSARWFRVIKNIMNSYSASKLWVLDTGYWYSQNLWISFSWWFYQRYFGGSGNEPEWVIKVKVNQSDLPEHNWDPSFYFLSGKNDDVKSLIWLKEYADNSLYVVYQSFQDESKIVKLALDGSLDTNFPPVEFQKWKIRQILFLQDKRILITGTNTDGKNTTFVTNLDGTQKIVWAEPLSRGQRFVGQQPSGKIIYEDKDFANSNGGHIPYRVTPEWIRDTTYAKIKLGIVPQDNKTDWCGMFEMEDGVSSPMIVLPDGKIVIYENFSHVNDIPRKCIARLDIDGELDENFNPGTSFQFPPRVSSLGDVRISYDGQKRLIASGDFYNYNGFAQKGIVRINDDGTPDKSLTLQFNSGKDNPFTRPRTNPVIIGRMGDMMQVNGYSLMPTWIDEDKTCFSGTDTKKFQEAGPANICHTDDFQKGAFVANNKVYIPYKNSVSIYELSTGKKLKEIQRNKTLISSWGLGYDQQKTALVVGKYAYVGSYNGVDIIDLEKDEVVQTLGIRQKSDLYYNASETTNISGLTQFKNAQGQNIAVLSQFKSGQDQYVIGEDHIVYKVSSTPGVTQNIGKDQYMIGKDNIRYQVLSTPGSLDGRYITGDSTTQYVTRTLTDESQMVADDKTLNVVAWYNGYNTSFKAQSMWLVGKDIYVLGSDRMIIIDSETNTIVKELKYSPGTYPQLNITVNTSGGGSYTFNGGRTSDYTPPLITANNKVYIYVTAGASIPNKEQNGIWFVFDEKNRQLLKILENTKVITPGTCPEEYPGDPYTRFSQGDKIYLRTFNTACGTITLDTKTDTFSSSSDVPKSVETKLDLYSNSDKFFPGSWSGTALQFQYAGAVLKWRTEGGGYNVIRLSDNKKVDTLVSTQISQLGPMVQYGDKLFAGSIFANGELVTYSLSNGGASSCE